MHLAPCCVLIQQREQRSTPQDTFSRTRRETVMATHERIAADLPSIESSRSQDTIFTEVLATSFGKYYDAYQKIKPNTGLSVKLPRIVVVGMRNVGKSSLLENLTKCSIFPRDNGLCTKTPIRLQLKQVRSPQERKRSVTYEGVTHQVDVEKEVAEGNKDILHIIRGIMKETEGLGDSDIKVDISEVICSITEYFP